MEKNNIIDIDGGVLCVPFQDNEPKYNLRKIANYIRETGQEFYTLPDEKKKEFLLSD